MCIYNLPGPAKRRELKYRVPGKRWSVDHKLIDTICLVPTVKINNLKKPSWGKRGGGP